MKVLVFIILLFTSNIFANEIIDFKNHTISTQVESLIETMISKECPQLVTSLAPLKIKTFNRGRIDPSQIVTILLENSTKDYSITIEVEYDWFEPYIEIISAIGCK